MRRKHPRPVGVRLTEDELAIIWRHCLPHETLSDCLRRLIFAGLY